MTIVVEKKTYKSFVSLRMLDSYKVVSIIFLIYYSTAGRASYIYLDKLHFLFDLLMCKKELTELPKLTLPPWKIDRELKNILIVLTQNKLIEQSYDDNKVRYSLTETGNKQVHEMLNIPELALVATKANTLSSSLTNSVFKKSKVIF